MIPAFITVDGSPWEILPPGIHQATLDEIEKRFATNAWRYELFNGLVDATSRLRFAGCRWIYLDGSYVTGKPRPGDFDVCWAPADTDPDRLDPIFFDFTNQRATQKAMFKGEFFPSTSISNAMGQTFVEFFQLDRFTGGKKGIVSVFLPTDPLLQRKADS